MGSEAHHCPDCGQSVETVVRRHKTLGAWVPTWVAGPCRNPECGAYAGGDAEHEKQHQQWGRPVHHEQPEHQEQPEHHEQSGSPTANNF